MYSREPPPGAARRRGMLPALTMAAAMLLGACDKRENPAELNAAASVPAATVQRVTQVISPMGSASVADAASLPALTGDGESFLLAGDASAEIYLAAMATATSPAPPFSAETTAVALVRLARGPLPDGVGAAAFNAAIRSAAGYEPLLTLVRAAGTAGTPPMRHPGVTEAVLTTLGQALQALQPAVEGRAGPLAMAMAPVRVNAPYPFDILRAGTAGRLRLSVQEAMPTAPGVLVVNRLPITFGARAEDLNAAASGLPALPPGDDSPSVLLPSTGLLGPAPGEPTPWPVAGLGRGWNLAVYRTPGARTYDGRELAVALWNTALQGLGAIGEACQQTVASGWPPGGLVAAWSVLDRDAGFAGLRADLESGALLRSPAQASAECLQQRIAALPAAEQARVRAFLRSTEAEGLWQQVSRFARAQWALWLRTLELPDIQNAGPSNALGLYEGAAGGASAALLVHQFWSWARTVGVCQYQAPETGLWQMNPCPSELAFDRPQLTLPVGSRYRYDIIASDAQGNRIATPPGLQFTSSSPFAVRVTPDGEITVEGLPIFGLAYIRVTDPASGVEAEAVVEPVPGPPPPPTSETLDFESGVWFAGSYFQGGPTAGTPGGSGFRFYRNGGLDDPLLSRTSGRYVSGLHTARPSNAASDPYFVAVERSDGQPFEALSVEVGLFDNAAGSSFQRPALLFLGVRPDGSRAEFSTSPADFQSFGSGAALATVTLPPGFDGLRRLEIRLKLNPNACSSCRVALTVDNLAVR
jgi:hypothetical protein